MKRILPLLAFLCCALSASFAQTTPPADPPAPATPPALMSIGFDIGSSVGQTSKMYGTTTGLSFKFELPFADPALGLTLTAGYSNYSVKSSNPADTMQSGHFIPVEVGFKYYVYNHMYVEGDVGESFNINQNYFGYQTAFIYSPVVGVYIPVQQNTAAVDLSLRYEARNEAAGNFDQVAFRIAYRFGL